MITSLKTIPNNNHSIEHDHNQLSSTTQINCVQNMSILTDNNNKTYQEKDNKNDDDDDDDDDDDENSKLVSVNVENNEEQQQQQHQQEQQISVTTLRSILRKRTEKKMSTEGGSSSVEQASITIDENVNGDEERDSDYTGDENEEESNRSSSSNKSIGEESENNEQQQEQHEHTHNYSRHQQRDHFFRTSPSAPLVFPLEATETGTTTTTSAIAFNGNDQSSSRTACVTFTNDQPIIIHRSSSTPQLGGLDIQPRSSITYINMKDDISTIIPITTTGLSATLGAEFRPVYISPLKYRPLVGLSANDSRILLEKRVSLLGKPLICHPIQKRSPSYRRTQLRIYNHTFV
jgi:hypothetical protein